MQGCRFPYHGSIDSGTARKQRYLMEANNLAELIYLWDLQVIADTKRADEKRVNHSKDIIYY